MKPYNHLLLTVICIAMALFMLTCGDSGVDEVIITIPELGMTNARMGYSIGAGLFRSDSSSTGVLYTGHYASSNGDRLNNLAFRRRHGLIYKPGTNGVSRDRTVLLSSNFLQ